jgi:MarR family 2-MHQ and catechol resistance regulon transcriptional repressor
MKLLTTKQSGSIQPVMPPDGSDPRYAALLALLRAADTIWNASHALFARWDLSPSQFNVLNLLGDRPDGLTQTELGRALIMHRSNVTGLVDRLERRGLVARHEAARDRRAWRVRLTPAGARLLRAIRPRYLAAASQVWGALPAPRVRALARELDNLTANALNLAATRDSSPS